MTYFALQLDLEPPLATITLNRPEVHNALNAVLISELAITFDKLSADATVRAIVLRGDGKSFCAGADLGFMQKGIENSFEQNLEDARALRRMYAAINECPKVTIARVHGAAIGGGAGLVAVCDIAIAAPEARFALSEVRLGIVPAVIGPFVLERIGLGAARALFVTGDRIDATEALRIGLVNEVVAAGELDAAIDLRLHSVLQSGPGAIAAAKLLLRQIAGLSLAESSEISTEAIAQIRVSPEGQEGIRAFLEKRKPGFAIDQ